MKRPHPSSVTPGDRHSELLPDRAGSRFVTISLLASTVILLLIGSLFSHRDWHSGSEAHTRVEIIATVLALFVGTLALIRFYSIRENLFLFLGTGFLGTAFLDGYHAIVTADEMFAHLPSSLPTLIPWSWVASRFFLSSALCISWLLFKRELRIGKKGRYSEVSIYCGAGFLTIFSFLFFALFPLPRAYYPEFYFGRPEEFVPAILFAIAFVGYYYKGAWRTDRFEFCMMCSILLGFVCQAAFMSRSFGLFDGMFDLAHYCKVVSYGVVLVGLLDSIFTAFRDSRVHAEEQSSLVRQLAKKNEETEHLLYVVSHDLKSPLVTISGFSGILERHLTNRDEAKARESLQKIKRGTRLMSDLIDGILTINRLEGHDLEYSRIEINEVVHHVESLLSMQINTAQAHIEVLPNTPEIWGDHNQIIQVFLNLIGNALKYGCDKVGSKIIVGGVEDFNEVKLFVQDQGMGIDPQFHQKIFKLFQRLESKKDGSGLGLATVSTVAHRHGGIAWVESNIDAGATFWFSIAKRHEIH